MEKLSLAIFVKLEFEFCEVRQGIFQFFKFPTFSLPS
jgi:hypothetical protein